LEASEEGFGAAGLFRYRFNWFHEGGEEVRVNSK